jgi:heat shock protein HslJ
MSGIAPPAGRHPVVEKIQRGALKRVIATAILSQIALALTVATAQTSLPARLESPDLGVVCNRQRAICYDRHGANFGLTEEFLGHAAAERLIASLRRTKTGQAAKTIFSPADEVDCVLETGPCRLQFQPDAALTAVLFEPTSRPFGQKPEMRAILYGEWDWQRTRYKNGTETRPHEPEHYVLRFEPDGSLTAKVDCNSAGGKYQFEGTQITLKLTNSTLMSCQPGSLEDAFQRGLAAATAYSMIRGRLVLALKKDAGTMEFDRPAAQVPPGS